MAKNTDVNTDIHAIGSMIYRGLSEEERSNLGCKSDTVQLVHMLGTKSKPIQRHLDSNNRVSSFDTVGMVLRFDERTEIPYLPIRPKEIIKSSGFTPEEMSKTRWVEAGEEVAISEWEWMFLVARPEYCGKIRGVGKHPYLKLQVIFNKYINGESKLPIPTPTYHKGSPSEDMDTIDEKDIHGEWKVKEEYARFAGIHVNKQKTPMRDGAKIEAAQTTALAIHRILEDLKRNESK